MMPIKQKLPRKPHGWLCLLTLLICTCAQLPEHCGDFVSIAAGTQCPGDTTPTAYTITFNPNGGTVYPTSATTGTDGQLTSLPTPTRSDHTFDGWFTAATGGTAVNTSTVFDANTSVFAQWTAITATTYTLTVNAGTGGTASGGGTFEAGTNASITATPNTGCTFVNWTPATGINSPNSQNTTVSISESRTVTANFDCPPPPIYTITFNVNGGNALSPSTALTDASGRLTSLPTPTRSGFTFDGWFTAATGGTSVTTSTVFNANTTIFARWTAVTPTTYTLTVNTSGTGSGNVTRSVGGSTTTATSFNAGTVVTLTAQPNSGSTFGGWSGGGCSDTGSCAVTMNSNVTVTATFTSSGGGGNACVGGSFTDARDGRTYRCVTIGTQTWIAENLNFNASGSVCYNNQESNCNTYGRLYNWAQAMDLPSNCNSTSCASQVQSRHQGICPVGWHVPSDAEWTTLTNFVGSSTAGTRLKSTSGWDSGGNGTDDFGFSALPGGRRWTDGTFYSGGNFGYWWSATEDDASLAWHRYMDWYRSDVSRHWDDKTVQFSLRCLQD